MKYGPATEKKIEEVRQCLDRHGSSSMVLLSGVAGTGKTLIALASAQRFAGHPLLVKQIQFHQGYSYEDFIEGLRADATGGFSPQPGLFLDLNDSAAPDAPHPTPLPHPQLTPANLTPLH